MSSGPKADRAPLWLLLVGLPIGFVSSWCGIGGGLFASSFLHFVMGQDLKRATGTGLVLVLATTGASTLTEVLQPDAASAIHWGLTGAMVLGALLGAKLGFAFSERVQERTLRILFAVVLLFSSAKILLGSGSAAEPGLAAYTTEAWHYLWALVIGLGGGMVAPILGVGGGLLMVPGLFLGLPGLGFNTARACSLAAGVAGSARSLGLKHRAGRVCWRQGLLLGAGALLGASLGVLALGRSLELIDYGRRGIGVILALVGLRFVVELVRGKQASAPRRQGASD